MLSPTDRSRGNFEPPVLLEPHPVTSGGQKKYKRSRAANLEDPIRITRSQSESSPLKDSPAKDIFDLDEPLPVSPRRAFKRTKTVRPTTPVKIQRIPRVGTLSPVVIPNSDYFIEAPSVAVASTPSTPPKRSVERPKRELKVSSPVVEREKVAIISGEESQAWSLFQDLEVRKTPKRFRQKSVEVVEEESPFVKSIHQSLVELHDSPPKKAASKSPSPPLASIENPSNSHRTYASARTFLMDECDTQNDEDDNESDSGPVQNLHDLRHSGSVNRFSDTLHYFFEPFEDITSNNSTRQLALIELNDKVLKDEAFAKDFESSGIPAAVVSSVFSQTEEDFQISCVFLITLCSVVLHGGNEGAQNELMGSLLSHSERVKEVVSMFLSIDEPIKDRLDRICHKKMIKMAIYDLLKTMQVAPSFRTLTLNFLVGVSRREPDRPLFDVDDVLTALHKDIEGLANNTHFYVQMGLVILEDMVDGSSQFSQLSQDVDKLIRTLPEKSHPNRRNHVLCCIPGLRIALTMLNKGSTAMLDIADPLLAIVQTSEILSGEKLAQEEHDLVLYSLGFLVALADESGFHQSLSKQSLNTIHEMLDSIDSKTEKSAHEIGYFCLFVGILQLSLSDSQKTIVRESLEAFLKVTPETGNLRDQIVQVIELVAL